MENYPTTNDAKFGTAEPHKWEPYKIWQADLWACPSCGHELIVGAGLRPMSERHMSDFEVIKNRYDSAYSGGMVRVNDC